MFRRHSRCGSITVLTAILMIMVMAIVAFAVDIGVMLLAKTDLQRAADAAAHAGVLEYATTDGAFSTISNVRNASHDWVTQNTVLGQPPTVAHNWFNMDRKGDIVVGWFDFENPKNGLSFGDADQYNAIRVRIRRNERRNGEVPFFFARVLGHDSVALEGEATAAIMRNVRGFRISSSGENVPILPITISKEFWEDTLASKKYDNWSWDSADKQIEQGADGVPEVVLFPQTGNTAGNFGTVNVGTSSNATSYIADQIRYGLSQQDLDYHGGDIKLDENGKLDLTGDTGLSASLKDDLSAMAGEPRIIPLYESVVNPGDNATYAIVKFVGIRVMSVELTGGHKGVTVQPANVWVKGTIQGNSEGQSQQIYSPALIVE